MTEVKHDRKRSFSRMLGQSVALDAAGKQVAVGSPIEVRIAHPFVHELRTKTAGGDKIEFPGYSAAILVPKLNADATKCANYAALAAHVMEAATAAWGSWPQGGMWPIKDGDVPYEQKLKPGVVPLTPEQVKERNKWREGSWCIEVESGKDYPPQVAIVQNGAEVPITSKSAGGVPYYKSGDYGVVFVHAFTFHNKKFGCDFGFNGLIFTRPGERIGNSGQRSIASMFGGLGAGFGAGMAAAQPGQAGPIGTGGPALPTSASAPLPPGAAPAAPPPTPPQPAPGPVAAPPAPPAPPAAPSLAPPPPPPGGVPSLPIPGQ